jgi:hypothetical protein
MLAAALPDLESLDIEAMKALVIEQHERYPHNVMWIHNSDTHP